MSRETKHTTSELAQKQSLPLGAKNPYVESAYSRVV